jgi:hypothetical protein
MLHPSAGSIESQVHERLVLNLRIVFHAIAVLLLLVVIVVA